MFEKALKLDGTRFKKTKGIRAKRPSEYWLLFFKTYLLKKQPRPFRLRYLLFAIPLAAIIYLMVGGTGNIAIPFIMITLFVSFFVNALFAGFFDKNAYVDINSFNNLAKFIIDIKGDVYKNLINMRLSYGVIENEKHAVVLNKLNLKQGNGIKYKAYQIERYNSAFTLKDGSQIIAALHQITIKVSTTKRRSSGKTKTKFKYKHKMFYSLMLKLDTKKYDVIKANKFDVIDSLYTVSIIKKDDLYIIKVKFKHKLLYLIEEMTSKTKEDNSIFTEMLISLIEEKVIIPKNSNALLAK